MKFISYPALAAVILLTTPAMAAQKAPEATADKPVIEKDVTAADVATTPLADLNLRKGEIPAILVAAQQEVYALRGIASCPQIARAIADLDAVLGEDIDLPQEGDRRTSPGRVAQSVVGSFIPFRGLIREVSGASNRERELQAAIMAGVARRSFLKGMGQARGCRYPARSATLAVFNQRMDELNAPKPEKAPPARNRH